MAELLDSGISVSELLDEDHAIPIDSQCVTAFIGRSSSGPLNRATEITSITDFARVFGGAWGGSLLPEAVSQYFRHGGRRAVIVRVANGASGAEIVLPADSGALVLGAVNPGSAESLRAAVDFDGIRSADGTEFNLTVQRLSGASRRITDQEFFRKVSVAANSDACVVDVLASSKLVRVKGIAPERAPRATGGPDGTGDRLGYVGTRHPGHDGDVLTDYDLIGSTERGTGLFALNDVESFDFLYAPPPHIRRQPGPVFLAAAERYCAARSSMLILDPPADAGTHAAASCQPAIRSVHAIAYYPRPVRRDDPSQAVPVGAALAGMLAGATEAGRIAASFEDTATALTREFTASEAMSPARIAMLQRSGVNALVPGRDGRLRVNSALTTDRGLYDDMASLRTARVMLLVRRALESGTRWAVFAKPGRVLWRRLEMQVGAFLAELGNRNVLCAEGRNARHFVHCDSVTNASADPQRSETHFIVGFTPTGEPTPIVLSVTQSPYGAHTTRAAFVADLAENA